jgi:hypothetical protein
MFSFNCCVAGKCPNIFACPFAISLCTWRVGIDCASLLAPAANSSKAQESAALAARSTTTVIVPTDVFIDGLLGLACWSFLRRGMHKFEGFEQLEKDHSGVKLQVASIVLFVLAGDNGFARTVFCNSGVGHQFNPAFRNWPGTP